MSRMHGKRRARVNGARLQRKKQRDRLQRVRAAIDIVAEEQVINVRDVACCRRTAVLGEQAHQVTKLTMQVAENLDRRRQLKHGAVEGE